MELRQIEQEQYYVEQLREQRERVVSLFTLETDGNS